MHITVVQNTAQKSSGNLPSYPPERELEQINRLEKILSENLPHVTQSTGRSQYLLKHWGQKYPSLANAWSADLLSRWLQYNKHEHLDYDSAERQKCSMYISHDEAKTAHAAPSWAEFAPCEVLYLTHFCNYWVSRV